MSGDEGKEPFAGSHRLDRRLGDRLHEPVERGDDDRVEDLPLGTEVVVHARLGDPDGVGQTAHADVLESLPREELGSTPDHALALVVVQGWAPETDAAGTSAGLTRGHPGYYKPTDR